MGEAGSGEIACFVKFSAGLRVPGPISGVQRKEGSTLPPPCEGLGAPQTPRVSPGTSRALLKRAGVPGLYEEMRNVQQCRFMCYNSGTSRVTAVFGVLL